MSGELILVPTPLQDHLPLESVALERLKVDCLNPQVILLVEEHKNARQRWLKWGLPREAIEKFQLFNEHNQQVDKMNFIKQLKSGFRIYLLSDCGLPAFCDPGQELVEKCHQENIVVTSTPFPQSTILALALSGFPHDRFHFLGFPPLKSPMREEWIKKLFQDKETFIIMDTPYRLSSLLHDLMKASPHQQLKRLWGLMVNLNGENQQILIGSLEDLHLKSKSLGKPEFILIAKRYNIP
jgi:16S rRNA (cytidine1402-2'-O)-methyltransferase